MLKAGEQEKRLEDEMEGLQGEVAELEERLSSYKELLARRDEEIGRLRKMVADREKRLRRLAQTSRKRPIRLFGENTESIRKKKGDRRGMDEKGERAKTVQEQARELREKAAVLEGRLESCKRKLEGGNMEIERLREDVVELEMRLGRGGNASNGQKKKACRWAARGRRKIDWGGIIDVIYELVHVAFIAFASFMMALILLVMFGDLYQRDGALVCFFLLAAACLIFETHGC